jgi:hypothetical protein
MTRTDRALLIILRVLGVSALFALVAVVMPASWIAATHRWLGLGELPAEPIVEYLARSLSAYYALIGALCLVVAADLGRYRALARFLAAAIAVMGVAQTGIDLAAGLPWWWTAFEGPPTAAVGIIMVVLARPAQTVEGPGRSDAAPVAR